MSYNHIIDNIFLGDIFSLTDKTLMGKIQQTISLVENPFQYNDINKIEVLFEDKDDVDIIYYSELIYPYLDNGKPTLIHCQAGKFRSAAVVIYYIMKKYNLSFDMAENYVKSKRPCILLNKGFHKQLKNS